MRFVNILGIPAGLRSVVCVQVLIVSLYEEERAHRNQNGYSARMWFVTTDSAVPMNHL